MSCCESKDNSVDLIEQVIVCPICNGDTKQVKEITVRHFVLDSLVNKVKEGNYYICLNESCDVVYYNLNENIIIKKQEVKVPIWYKKDANPKYICYCNQVTEKQIINAVLNDKAKDIKDVARFTGAMKNGQCEINNPFGKCCSPNIQKVIDKALSMK